MDRAVHVRDRGKLLGRHGAQRVRGDAEGALRVAAAPQHQPGDQRPRVVRVLPEPGLAGAERRAVEPAAGIDAGHQRQPHPGGVGGGQDAQGEFAAVLVGRAVRLVLQVVELAERGGAGLQHLDLQLGGDGLDILRTNAAEEAVHQLPPAPETVAGAAGLLGEPGHGALEGVRVQVRQARHHGACQACIAGCGVHAGDPAGRVDLDGDARLPAVGQQGAGGMQAHQPGRPSRCAGPGISTCRRGMAVSRGR